MSNESGSGLGRRAFLQTVGAASLLSAGGCSGDAADLAAGTWASAALEEAGRNRVFQHGVASGDPLADRVILWTRVTLRDADDGAVPVPVAWVAARDPALADVVASGTAWARPDADFTVKVDAPLPDAGTTYFYRFEALGVGSPVGRTRTAPRNADHLRLAVVSCSSIWSGFMNGYDRIADRNDLDLVIHCGDYAYDELDPDEKVRPPVDETDWRKPRGLAGWRRRYAYYRLDRQLRRAHQCHPFAVTWDNHDLTIDGDVRDAIRAFHEWTPTRAPEEGRPERVFRTLPYGDLLDIILLDTRHVGRNSAIDPSLPVEGARNRSILGNEQYAWLQDEAAASRATWRVVMSQVLVAPFKVFGVSAMTNAWEGYPQDRERFLRLFTRGNVRNNVVVSGDAHMSFAANLTVDGRPAGVEFLPSSVTRGNLDETVKGFLATIAAWGLRAFGAGYVYSEQTSNGYGILDLTRGRSVAEFWYTPIGDDAEDQRLAAAVVTYLGADRFSRVNAPTATAGDAQAPPPPPETPLFRRSARFGGAGGTHFDDERQLPLVPRVERVVLRSGDRIDRVAMEPRERHRPRARRRRWGIPNAR